jgi:hypothetical protein
MDWHYYYSQAQIPHASAAKGSFWWKDLLQLCDKFRGVATCSVGIDFNILFKLDVWNGPFLQEKLPRLFSFTKDQKIYVACFIALTDLAEHFYLPLSNQAFQGLQEMLNWSHIGN